MPVTHLNRKPVGRLEFLCSKTFEIRCFDEFFKPDGVVPDLTYEIRAKAPSRADYYFIDKGYTKYTNGIIQARARYYKRKRQ